MVGLLVCKLARHSLPSPLVARQMYPALASFVREKKTNAPSSMPSKEELKKMSNKARVIAIAMARNSERATQYKKLIGKTKLKKTYEVHEKMSINVLSRVVGADKGILLDVALSHVKVGPHFALFQQ